MKKRQIPSSIIKFVQHLLANRKTRLIFDDYTSNPIPVTNGIGQGDPLSMLLYIIYNADLIDIPTNIASKDTLGYVDDIAIITIGSDFTKTTNRIKNIMTKPEGGLDWSKAHNSKFEVNKSAIMHLSRKSVQ